MRWSSHSRWRRPRVARCRRRNPSSLSAARPCCRADFDILRPFSSSVKTVGENQRRKARGRGCRSFPQRRSEPAAMLVTAFQIHHGILATVDLADDVAEAAGKFWRSSSTKACVRAGIEPDVADVVDFFPVFGGACSQKRSRAPSRYQASAPSSMKASEMRWLTNSSCKISAEPSPFSRTKHRDRHAPRRAGARSPSPGG